MVPVPLTVTVSFYINTEENNYRHEAYNQIPVPRRPDGQRV